ncbi:MAG: hypothetical protein ACREL9_07485 [Gemmatimonadales bacterium]
MRTFLLALALPGLLPGLGAAQAAPRSDTPRAGTMRLTFEPRIETWDHRFFNGARERLGAPLTGDTVGGGSAFLPVVARLQQDVRTASGATGFVASLGRGLFSVRHERRTTPITAEFGVTDRLAVGVTLPLVRVFTRAHLALDTAGASLGLNPRLADPGSAGAYTLFFADFDAALQQLDANIAAGSYGCPPSRQCPAQADLDSARSVRDALHRLVYGVGTAGAAPFLPRAGSDGGQAVAANVTRIQQELTASYGVAGFTDAFLLPADPVGEAGFATALADPTPGGGFGMRPFEPTPRRLRYWPGDVELAAQYRLAGGGSPAGRYAAAVALVVRLPTGHQDSPHDALDLSTGDHQTDVEVQVVQEAVLAGRLWLNLALRAARQLEGTRERRVAPVTAFLVPRGATTPLRWNPGDYAAVDVAPLYRFGGAFAAGVTVGYWTRARDRYRFRAAQDSIDLAARLGAPTAARVLDAGTAERRLRLGGALTYVGPTVEAGVSVEQTVSGPSGVLPAGTVFRIVLRTTRRLF